MARTFVLIGAVLGGLAVLTAALGGHQLKRVLEPEMLATFQTGAHYHLIHAVALLGVGAWIGQGGGRRAVVAGWLLVAGIVLFSGSLYLLALTGVRLLGLVTPFGGLSFVGGWTALAFDAWKGRG